MSYNSKYTGSQVDGLLERMDNLQVGGRNHYHEGLGMICMCPDGSYASPVRTETGFRMHTGLTVLTAKHTVRISNAIDGNGWWTVSFDLSTGSTSSSSRAAATIDVCDGDKSDTFEASGTEVVHCVFSVMVNNYTEAVYNFVDIEIAGRTSVPEVSNLQVERGNVATDYRPAPEHYDKKKSEVWVMKDVFSLGKSSTEAQIRAALGGVLPLELEADRYTYVNDSGNSHLTTVNVSVSPYEKQVTLTEIVGENTYTLLLGEKSVVWNHMLEHTPDTTLKGTSESRPLAASAGKALNDRLVAVEDWKGKFPCFCVPLRNITKGAATPAESQVTSGLMAMYWVTQASNGTPTVVGTSSTPVYGHYGYMLSVSESTVMLGNRTMLKVSVGPMNDYGNGFQVLTTTGTDVTDQYVLNGIIFGTK